MNDDINSTEILIDSDVELEAENQQTSKQKLENDQFSKFKNLKSMSILTNYPANKVYLTWCGNGSKPIGFNSRIIRGDKKEVLECHSFKLGDKYQKDVKNMKKGTQLGPRSYVVCKLCLHAAFLSFNGQFKGKYQELQSEQIPCDVDEDEQKQLREAKNKKLQALLTYHGPRKILESCFLPVDDRGSDHMMAHLRSNHCSHALKGGDVLSNRVNSHQSLSSGMSGVQQSAILDYVIGCNEEFNTVEQSAFRNMLIEIGLWEFNQVIFWPHFWILVQRLYISMIPLQKLNIH